MKYEHLRHCMDADFDKVALYTNLQTHIVLL